MARVCISQSYWKQHIQFWRESKQKNGRREETHNLETNYCPSLPERKRGREGGEKKRSGKSGRQEEETRDGRSTKQREDGGCTFIYCTHSMTDLHAIVVNSFVSWTTPPSHCTVPPVGLLQHGWRGDSGSWVVVWETIESWTVVRTLCLRRDICLGREQKWGRPSYVKTDWDVLSSKRNANS